MMQKILLMCIALLCSIGGWSQKITGKVMDEQSLPLQYVNVVLLALPDSAFVDGCISGEDGTFVLHSQRKKGVLRFSSIGYGTVYREMENEDVGIVKLLSNSQMLGEVVVKSDLPQTRIKEDAMLTTVAGTLLEKSGTVERLLDKIPGVSAGDGQVNVFGRGNAMVYINGRQMRDASELDRLSSADVKSVEVVTSPGARYAASVKAVVRITTKKAQGEGFSFDTRAVTSYNRDASWVGQFNFNYRKKHFDLFGTVYGDDGRSRNTSSIVFDSYLDKHWRQRMNLAEKSHYQSLLGILGMNYVIGNNHYIGASYKWNRTPGFDTHGRLQTEVWQDGTHSEETYSSLQGDSRSTNHNLNLYYNGQACKWSIDFNADGLWGRKDKGSNVDEKGLLNADDRIVTDKNRSEHALYAGKLVLARPLLGGDFSWGGEYAYATRKNDYSNLSGIIADESSEIREGSVSGFVEYGHTFGKMLLRIGLRYEHVNFDYYENGELRQEQSKTYDQLFPSLMFALPFGKKTMLSLSYKEDINRPGYQMLRGNMQYNNRYTYESGNPLLKPSVTRNAILVMTYDWLLANVSYSRVSDDFVWDSKPYSEENPTIAVLSHRNAPAYDKLFAYLYASKQIGIWKPDLGLGIQKQWYGMDTPEGYARLNEPAFLIQAGSDLKLPYGILLTAKFDWQSRHHGQNTEVQKIDWNLRFILYKEFLKGRFSAQLYANDVFNSCRLQTLMYFGALRTMWKRQEPSARSVSLTLRYKFNAARSKYKGTGAGAAQKNRM